MERRNDLMRSKRKELESEIEQYCRIQKADDTQIIEVKHAMFDSCIIMTPPEPLSLPNINVIISHSTVRTKLQIG